MSEIIERKVFKLRHKQLFILFCHNKTPNLIYYFQVKWKMSANSIYIQSIIHIVFLKFISAALRYTLSLSFFALFTTIPYSALYFTLTKSIHHLLHIYPPVYSLYIFKNFQTFYAKIYHNFRNFQSTKIFVTEALILRASKRLVTSMWNWMPLTQPLW